ncbi:MAG: PadR family transcriptional regulator [Oscillospiraceae bacterium]|nr:PadR family transcriptional regulator [Oscillospiraceae bacterium]
MNPQLKRGTLELCVLSIVCRGDCYGYELVNRISDNMHITEGTIYPLLKRLKDNGSITSYIVESQEGPPRKYYQITDIGRLEKLRQEKEWRSFSESMEVLLNGDNRGVTPIEKGESEND